MKIDHALTELHAAEDDLAAQLLAVAHRHAGDFEIAHVARDLAVWSQDHVRLLAEAGERYGVDLDPEPAGDPSLAERVRQGVADRFRSPGGGRLQLLRDLRRIYVDASGVSVDWELVAQAAQGVRDRQLLELASSCHPDTLRQARWANSQLKESAPQILSS